MSPSYACRKDANHTEIKQVFKGFGFSVIDTSSALGLMLDLLVYLDNGFFQFIETKDGNKPKSQRKLTKNETYFINKHLKFCKTIKSREEAINFCSYVIAGSKF